MSANLYVDDLDEFLDEQMHDPVFASAYQDAEDRAHALRTLVALRKSLGLRQSDVAERMGCTQSGVSQFEGGASDFHMSTLQRYARAVDSRVQVFIRCDGGRDTSSAGWPATFNEPSAREFTRASRKDGTAARQWAA